MKSMTAKERIDAVLSGQKADRIPVSFWRHFYQHEDTPSGLADAMLLYQENYKWDFMKVNPRASYHHEDWGAGYRFFKDGLTKPQMLDCPIKKISHLNRIKPLEPLKSPVLRDHLDALNLIRKGLAGRLHFVMTVFTPLSILADMCRNRMDLLDYIREDPALVESALEAVTETFDKFIQEVLNVGVSGLYYATTYWGTYDSLDDRLFDRFSRPYDLRLLKLAKDCPFNILHVCKNNNMLRRLADYPVAAVSWDTNEPSNPTLAEGKEIVAPKAVIGGIDHQKTIMMPDSEGVLREAMSALKQAGSDRWILGAGCTYPPGAPEENLIALRKWVEQVAAD